MDYNEPLHAFLGLSASPHYKEETSNRLKQTLEYLSGASGIPASPIMIKTLMDTLQSLFKEGCPKILDLLHLLNNKTDIACENHYLDYLPLFEHLAELVSTDKRAFVWQVDYLMNQLTKI